MLFDGLDYMLGKAFSSMSYCRRTKNYEKLFLREPEFCLRYALSTLY